ncbi:hypothetical protein [Streptomyces sp. NRRL B-24484]|uniref:hypothetical protein n=1 Tax=Streptomyces sp. NRRL B-24484 TaxID=1463833 RepID=UPI0004BFC421|nr:hypothetical protein [Streptomyces sp. NRRL B-24484]
MFNRLRRRRKTLTTVDMTLLLNKSLRRARNDWRQPRAARRRTEMNNPADFQAPLAELYHAHTQVIADVHGLALAARTGLPESSDSGRVQEALDWAAFLLGQAEVALREAAVATCPDTDRLPARRS